jgi:hypothetical protein
MIVAGFQLSLTYLGTRLHGPRQGLSVVVLADAICALHDAADNRDPSFSLPACLPAYLAIGRHEINFLPLTHDTVVGRGRYKPCEQAIGQNADVTC